MPRALEILRLPMRRGKPRESGLTLVRDQGLGLQRAESVLETCAEFVDYVKIKQFEIWYMNPELTRRKVQLYRRFGVTPFVGGTVMEAAVLRGMVREALQELADMEFSCIELSDNIVELSVREKCGLIEQAGQRGFEVFFEYGKKYPEAAFDPVEAATEIQQLLRAGASRVIIERSEVERIIPPDPSRAADGSASAPLLELIQRVGLAPLIFEAEEFWHQAYLLRSFGPEVNIGPNLDPEYVVAKLEPARYGLGRDEGYSFFKQLMNP